MKRGAPGEVEFDAHEAEVALVALLSSFLGVTEGVKGPVKLVWSYDSLRALRTAAARTMTACVPERPFAAAIEAYEGHKAARELALSEDASLQERATLASDELRRGEEELKERARAEYRRRAIAEVKRRAQSEIRRRAQLRDLNKTVTCDKAPKKRLRKRKTR